jgi:hypothetical protein
MALDGEVGLLGERGELFGGNADIDIDDAMAGGAGQVVVMFVAAHAIAMRSIGKLDAVQQSGVDQHFYGAVDRRAPQARLAMTEVLPEIIHRKVSPAMRQFDQALGNHPARARITLALLVKHGVNLVCNHGRAFLSPGRMGTDFLFLWLYFITQ